MKRLTPVVLLILLLTVASAVGVWQQYQRFLQTPLGIESSGLVLNVEPGSNLRSVLMKLDQQGATSFDWRWRMLGRLHGDTIKAGEYMLTVGIMPGQLLKLLSSGKVVSYRFTIVEGWTVKQLLAELGKNPVLLHTIETVSELEKHSWLPAGNPEGWFLPETYVFARGDSDLQMLKRAFEDMQAALAMTWYGREEGLPFETPEELLIMASIVEKETSIAGERAEIAGVFVRRLRMRWRLETDPAVIYGMGDTYQGDIRRRDLKKDTPYNTYTRYGLPPTPIALPGLAALQAAAHPADGEAMFFVANGQGGHTFSSTLEEHNKAVRDLLKRNRSKPVEPGSGS
jgi:UPF0755 protein